MYDPFDEPDEQQTLFMADPPAVFRGIGAPADHKSDAPTTLLPPPPAAGAAAAASGARTPLGMAPVQPPQPPGPQPSAVAPGLDSRLRNWNAEFQALLDNAHAFGATEWENPQSAAVYRSLLDLAGDFEDTISMYAKVIVQERSLPVDLKTVKPVDVGGVAGGTKFIVNNILFKFAASPVTLPLYDNDPLLACKAAAHELRGMVAVLQTDIDIVQKLRAPLSAIVDFRGVRLLATALAPISRATLVYGSGDSGRTVVCANEEAKNATLRMAAKLNLAPHTVHGVVVAGPVDMEVHTGADGRFYAIDTHRLFPPDHPPSLVPVTPFKFHHLAFQLRPELVAVEAHPLSSDAWCRIGDYASEEANLAVCEASVRLQHAAIAFPTLKFNTPMARMSCTDLVHALHAAGVNVRHCGLVWLNIVDQADRTRLFAHMVARVIKRSVRRAWLDAGPSKASDSVCIRLCVEQINLVLGRGTASRRYWAETFSSLLCAQFVGLLPEDILDAITHCYAQLDRLMILQDSCFMCGLHLPVSLWESIRARPEPFFASAHPLYAEDVSELAPVTSHMSLFTVLRATVALQEAAYHARLVSDCPTELGVTCGIAQACVCVSINAVHEDPPTTTMIEAATRLTRSALTALDRCSSLIPRVARDQAGCRLLLHGLLATSHQHLAESVLQAVQACACVAHILPTHQLCPNTLSVAVACAAAAVRVHCWKGSVFELSVPTEFKSVAACAEILANAGAAVPQTMMDTFVSLWQGLAWLVAGGTEDQIWPRHVCTLLETVLGVAQCANSAGLALLLRWAVKIAIANCSWDPIAPRCVQLLHVAAACAVTVDSVENAVIVGAMAGGRSGVETEKACLALAALGQKLPRRMINWLGVPTERSPLGAQARWVRICNEGDFDSPVDPTPSLVQAGLVSGARAVSVSHKLLQCFVACGSEGLRVWDITTGVVTCTVPQETDVTLLDPTGQWLYSTTSAAKAVHVWSVQMPFAGPLATSKFGITTTPLCLSHGAQSNTLYIGGLDGHLVVVDAASGSIRSSVAAHTGMIQAVCPVYSMGLSAASGGADHVVKLWDHRVRTAVSVLTGHSNCVYSVSFRDGLVASGGRDGKAFLWDIRKMKVAMSFQDHTSGVTTVVCPHGTPHLFTSSRDGTVLCRNVTDPDYPPQLVHQSWTGSVVSHLAVAGPVLVSADSDGKLRAWC